MSANLRLQRLHAASLCALAVAILLLASLAVRAYQRREVIKRIASEFERLNARVVIAGYEDSARWPIALPVVQEILTHRSQAEVFMYDPATTEQVLDAVEQRPEVKRIWVNLNVFDRSMQTEIEQRIPGMDVIMYTPGPGMK